jgi:hypothetical protein
MIRFFIILYCLLLCLFLVVAVLGFLGDRIGVLPIWKTQPWLTLKIPIIVITVIVGIILLVVILSRISKKQERAEKEFAQSQGWIYTESYNDPQGRTQELAGKLEKVCPEKKFDVRNNMAVESGKRNIFLFGCWYNVRDWGPKEHHGFACLIESDRFAAVGSQVDISGRGSIDELLLSNQVDMGDSEFARNFIVTSKNPASAKRVVMESLQAVLLESKMRPLDYYEINIGPGGAVIITGAYKTFEEYLALVDLARQIESVFE